MKIRLLSPTNIRLNPNELSMAPIGILHAGVELEVDNRLYRGANQEGVDTYFRDHNGWYYWSGRAVVLYKALPSPKPIPEQPAEDIGGDWALTIAPQDEPATLVAEQPLPEPPPVISVIAEPTEEAAEEPQSLANIQPIEPEALSGPAEQNELIEASEEVLAAPIERSIDAPPPLSQWPQPAPQLKNWAHEALGITPLFWEQNKVMGQGIRILILSGAIDEQNPDFGPDRLQVVSFCSAPTAAGLDAGKPGSAIAGIAAGGGQQNWLGVAPQAQLWVGQVMDNAFGFNYACLADALHWAVEQAPDILLFGFDFRADSISAGQRMEVQHYIQQLSRSGTLCIAPVGEGSSPRPEDRWPACLEDCLSVGALDQNLQRLPSSMRSYSLNVMAPGEGLSLGTWAPAPTVQAAAFTAGLLALAMGWARQQQLHLDGFQWMQLIKDTALPQYAITKCRDMEYGCGRIQPAALLDALKLMSSNR